MPPALVDPIVGGLSILDIGGWGVAALLGVYIVTGFTLRGWMTPKQREIADVKARELELERKETIETQKMTIQELLGTVARMADAQTAFRDLFQKTPLRTASSPPELEAQP